MLLFDCHKSPIRGLRVGLTQALARKQRCKELSASTLLLLGRFGRFLLRGVGCFIAIGQFLCSCVAPALHAPRPQRRSILRNWAWKVRRCAGTVVVVLQAQAVVVHCRRLQLRPNSSFKPNPLRCLVQTYRSALLHHLPISRLRVGLIQALGLMTAFAAILFFSVLVSAAAVPDEVASYVEEREHCEYFGQEPSEGHSPEQIERREFLR